MTLDGVTLMRNAATAMANTAGTAMDIGAEADRTGKARRPTVIREHGAAAMGAGIRHVEEITSVTHRDHHHHHLHLARAEAEVQEAEDFLKVSVREKTIMKLVLANPRLRKIPLQNLSTSPWQHRNPKMSITRITTWVLSPLVLGSVQWSTL